MIHSPWGNEGNQGKCKQKEVWRWQWPYTCMKHEHTRFRPRPRWGQIGRLKWRIYPSHLLLLLIKSRILVYISRSTCERVESGSTSPPPRWNSMSSEGHKQCRRWADAIICQVTCYCTSIVEMAWLSCGPQYSIGCFLMQWREGGIIVFIPITMLF